MISVFEVHGYGGLMVTEDYGRREHWGEKTSTAEKALYMHGSPSKPCAFILIAYLRCTCTVLTCKT